ncbi:MAG: hypothetical protein U1C46_00235 [Bacteroidales bacterium]|nr:hypothetical protein [Bacteroidales bacterium]
MEVAISNLNYIFKDSPPMGGQVICSYNAITDAAGNFVETLSFDPWGRRRNPNTWTYINSPASSAPTREPVLKSRAIS